MRTAEHVATDLTRSVRTTLACARFIRSNGLAPFFRARIA
jgi:hypothetical protein